MNPPPAGRSRRQILIIGAIAAILAALVIAALDMRGGSDAPIRTERLAALTDLSSYTAEYGQQERVGLILAAEDAATGPNPRRISLDVQDTKGNAKDALNGLTQILSRPDKPAFLFSALSSVSTAILPTADRASLLTLCNATSDAPLKLSKNSIRNFPSPAAEFNSLYDGAVEPLGLKRMGILVINDEYGQAMAALFRQRAGAAGVLNEAYGFDLSDFRPLVTRLRTANTDGVVVVGYGSQAGSLIRQLREGGYQGRILVPSLIVNTDSVIKSAGNSLRGVVFNGFDYNLADPGTRQLLDRFGKRYIGSQSDIGVLAYVGARLVLEYSRLGATPADTLAGLTAAQPFDTVLGQVGFDGRSFIYPLKLYEVGPSGVILFTPNR